MTARRGTRRVLVRDLRAGQTVRVGAGFQTVEREVIAVERAADVLTRSRAAVPTAPNRWALRRAAKDIVRALDALNDCGREARLVDLGIGGVHSYSSSEDLTVVTS